MPDMRTREVSTTVFVGFSSTDYESVSIFKRNVNFYTLFICCKF